MHEIRIAKPAQYWQQRNFRPLTPVVRVSLPSPRQRVTVYLRLPKSGSITIAEERAADGMARLQWPPGSEADRVTYKKLRRHNPAGAWTVADVRGSRIDSQGREHFHVYRPRGGAPHAPLLGYEWLRADPGQTDDARLQLLKMIRSTPRATDKRPPGPQYVRHFDRLLDCDGCHQPNKPSDLHADAMMPLWPTDGVGWYVPQSVMRAAAELSATEDFHDPNTTDPFIKARCTAGDASVQRNGGTQWYHCKGSDLGPLGELDIAAALASKQPRAQALCRSRNWLWSRMAPEAQKEFVHLLEPCRENGAPNEPG